MSVGRGGPGRRRRWRDVRVYAGSASEICPPSHEMVWILTGYDGNQWTKLDQYIMPSVTCEGNCPLTRTQRRDPTAPGWCH